MLLLDFSTNLRPFGIYQGHLGNLTRPVHQLICKSCAQQNFRANHLQKCPVLYHSPSFHLLSCSEGFFGISTPMHKTLCPSFTNFCTLPRTHTPCTVRRVKRRFHCHRLRGAFLHGQVSTFSCELFSFAILPREITSSTDLAWWRTKNESCTILQKESNGISHVSSEVVCSNSPLDGSYISVAYSLDFWNE